MNKLGWTRMYLMQMERLLPQSLAITQNNASLHAFVVDFRLDVANLRFNIGHAGHAPYLRNFLTA